MKNKKTKALRFGKTASGTIELACPNPKSKSKDEKRLKKNEIKIDHINVAK